MLNEQQIANMEFNKKFFKNIIENEKQNPDECIDLQKMMSQVNRERRWIYRGSFTTPPALEGVLWNVIDDV